MSVGSSSDRRARMPAGNAQWDGNGQLDVCCLMPRHP